MRYQCSPWSRRAVLALALFMVPALASRGQEPAATADIDWRGEFLQLCDIARRELNQPNRRVAFYQESYAVRALAVAYDLTGKKAYLDACIAWCDRMVEFQKTMTPAGAYTMNYGRKPGATQGDWYVADAACIAMAVLATSVRCDDPEQKEGYLRSVESFAKLVMDNYVGPSQGITDGLWRKYDGEWWCSSGVFGSLAFLLYEETGKQGYLDVALGALDWLNQLDFRTVKHISFEEAAPSVLMYILEAHSAGLPHLQPGTPRHKATFAQLDKALRWMAENQTGRGGTHTWDYNSQWGSKLGGMPFHMYVVARHGTERQALREAADQELRYVSSLLFKEPSLSQLTMFSMMSYAERVAPGALFRKSK